MTRIGETGEEEARIKLDSGIKAWVPMENVRSDDPVSPVAQLWDFAHYLVLNGIGTNPISYILYLLSPIPIIPHTPISNNYEGRGQASEDEDSNIIITLILPKNKQSRDEKRF